MKNEVQATALSIVAILSVILLLPLRVRAAAGMPSVAFHADIKASFYEAVPGDGDTFYAVFAASGQLAHLDRNGHVLNDLNLNANVSGDVTHCARDANGNLFVAGYLTAVDGGTQSSVMKLSSAGAVDHGFPAIRASLTSGDVYLATAISRIAADGEGGCWIAGGFDHINSLPANGLAHIKSNGTIDIVPRLHPSVDPILCLAPVADGVIVVERSAVYEILSAGGFRTFDVAGTRWTAVQAATYDPRFGLAIAGATDTIYKCFVYSAGGDLSTSFQSTVGFIGVGPNQLSWDGSGRLLVCSAQLADSPGVPVSHTMGVKRLLANGQLDPSWYQGLDFALTIEFAIPLADSVIVSGPFTKVGGYPSDSIIKLSAEDAASRLPVQSVLGWVNGSNQSMVVGMVVRGDYMVPALVRVSGPSLQSFGIPKSPSKTYFNIYKGQDLFLAAAPGSDSPTRPYSESGDIQAATKALGAFQLATGGFDEAEAMVVLQPGVYTVQVSAPSGQSGQVLSEVYFE